MIDAVAKSQADAIREAKVALGGEATVAEVADWITFRYPGRWRDPSTAMADLTYPGNASSTYPAEARFLERVSRGRYRLRQRLSRHRGVPASS